MRHLLWHVHVYLDLDYASQENFQLLRYQHEAAMLTCICGRHSQVTRSVLGFKNVVLYESSMTYRYLCKSYDGLNVSCVYLYVHCMYYWKDPQLLPVEGLVCLSAVPQPLGMWTSCGCCSLPQHARRCSITCKRRLSNFTLSSMTTLLDAMET